MKRIKRAMMAGVISLSVGTVYATGTDAGSCGTTVEHMQKLFEFLSWSWMLFATIAGKLMTNTMVLGEGLHLDQYLFKIHNVMRNFANFGLGFFLLWIILKNILSHTDAAVELTKKIGGLLLAGLLIQGSRFVIVALIDVSTVATVGVGAFPSMVLSKTPQVADNVRSNYTKYPMTYTRDIDCVQNKTCFSKIYNDGYGAISEDDYKILDDYFFPRNNTMAGPLLFIGNSILDALSLDTTNINFDGMCGSAALAIKVVLNVGIIIMYSLAMLMLAVINIIRIALIWLLIALGPLFFLVRGLKRGGAIDSIPKQMEDFGFANFLKLIFVPVRIVVFLGMLLLFLNAIWAMLAHYNQNMTQFAADYGVSTRRGTTQEGDGMRVDGVTTITIKGDIFAPTSMQEQAQTTFSQIIMVIFSLVAMWILIKASFSGATGFGFIDKSLEGWFGKLEGLATQLPVVPIGPKGMSIQGIKETGRRAETKALQTIFNDDTISGYGDLDSKGKDNFNAYMQERFGMPISLTGKHRQDLEKASLVGRDITGLIDTAQRIWGENNINEPLNVTTGSFSNYLTNFLYNNKDNLSSLTGNGFNVNFVKTDKDNILENFLAKGNNAKLLHDMLIAKGLVMESGGTSRPTDKKSMASNNYRGKKSADDNQNQVAK